MGRIFGGESGASSDGGGRIFSGDSNKLLETALGNRDAISKSRSDEEQKRKKREAEAAAKKAREDAARNPINQIGSFIDSNIVRPTAKFVGETGNTLASIPAGSAAILGSTSKTLTDQQKKSLVKDFKTKVDNSLVSKDIASGKADVGKFITGFTQAGLEGAQYVAPVGALGRSGRIFTKAAAQGGFNAGAAGSQSVLDDVNNNRPVDWGNAGKNALLGGFFGAVVPTVAPAVKKLSGSVPDVGTTKVGQSVANSSVGKKVTDWKDQFVAKIVDDTNYIKKPFKGATDAQTGRKVTDEIEDRVTNVRQFAGLAEQRRDNNQAWNELKTIIGGDEKTYDDFGNFIKQKQNALNNRKLGKDLTTVTGTPQQEAAYKLLNQSTKDDVQYMFDNGMIDETKYTKWMADPNYTRVQRQVDQDFEKRYGSGLGSVARVTDQRLKGSSKEALDPFAAYVDWQQKITLEVERNKLRGYIRDQGIKNGTSNKLDTTDQGVERIRQLYGEDGLRQKTLPVFENGMKELYTIDPRAARQLAGASDLELRAVSNVLLFPSRVLRGGATSLNPAFAIPNFIRDQVSSAINSKNARATHNPLAVWEGIKEAIAKPTLRATVGKLPGQSERFEMSPQFKEYLARNANMTSVDLARNLKSATREAQEQLGVKGETLIRRYENIISASEKATRYQSFIGTYRKALKNNVPPEQALQQANAAARTNSINFSNRGEISTFMKIFNPYFNAGVQGSATLAKAIANRPLASSLKIGATLLMPTAVSTYYNLSDPDRAEIYARIPQYERDSNLIMVLGGDKGYIKVPLPPGVRSFAKPLRNFVESEYLGDRQGFLETAKNVTVDAFSPVGSTVNEVLGNTIPQAVKPLVEIGMNKEFYSGNQIIPDSLKDKAPEEQVFGSTPQIYREIGKALGMSPLQVRKALTGYTAGGGEGAVVGASAATGMDTAGRSLPEQINKRFYSPNPSDKNNQVVSKFYDTYTPLRSTKESVSSKINDALASGDTTKASALARGLNKIIDTEKSRLKETYGKFETDLTSLYERFDSLKFSLEDGKLSSRSIKQRLNNLKDK